MARRADDPPGPVVVANPDDDCSHDSFHALIDELRDGPEPVLESIGAGLLVAKMRLESERT
jgi:hypothetical protein